MDCYCQRTTDEKVVDIELKTSDYIGEDLSSFDRFCSRHNSLVFLHSSLTGGWQLTLCVPRGHIISCTGVVKFHKLLYFLLLPLVIFRCKRWTV